MTPLFTISSTWASIRTSAWKRRLVYGLGSILLLWALAWLALPTLLKSQIESLGSQALGRSVTLGAVDFKPWSLELTLTDLAIATADGKSSQFNVARVYVDAELQSILRLGPVLDAVVVESPHLQLTHTGSGHYDIDDILARFSEPSTSAPLRFALYNLELRGGSVDFNDTPVGRQHQLQKLHVTLPFLSNLEAKRDITVEPRLAFELHGSAFDTAAQGTPFAQTRKGDANLKITRLDVTPFLPYLPAGLPVQAQRAIIDADVHLGFVQTPQVALRLSGTLKVSDLKLADASGADLLGVESIQAVLSDVRPLEQVAKLASLEITAPQLWASRNRAGRLNLDFSAPPSPSTATKKIAGYAHSTGATGQNDSQKPPAKAWDLELTHFALNKGTVNWSDDTTRPKAQSTLTDVTLKADAVRWPFADGPDAPARFSGSAALAAKDKPAQLQFEGQGTAQAGTLQATLADFALGSAAPYVARFLAPPLKGSLDAKWETRWQPDGMALDLQQLALHDVALQGDQADKDGKDGKAGGPAMQFKALDIADTQIDLTQQRIRIGKLALRAPQATVQRDEDGHWMYEPWLKTATAPAPASSSSAAPAKPGKPWSVVVDDLALTEGGVAFADRSLAKRVRFAVSGLNVQLKNATLDGKKPAPLTVSAQIKAGRTEPGTLSYQGTLMWDPLVVQGKLDLRDIPAHAIAPYFASQLNLELLRADTSFKGQLRYAAEATGARVDLKGDAALEDFRANSVLSSPGDLVVGEELLSWKSLNVPGIQLALAPGVATRLEVREAALTDFFARVVVNENGRINLQDLVKKDADKDAAPPAAAPGVAAAASAPVAEPAPVVGTAKPDAVIQMGPISLVHGKVLFSDRFIKPHYSADLSELTGKLSRFSSQAPGGVVQLADLDIRGRAEGTASLEITGKINPLAKPLALDIKGRVRDLELPPLSPYAIKYAGYGIDRGKLSMDVGYTVQPDGQLTATNQLVLNQLSFGDAVEGAPNSLPVKLAVALLADRNGVIDLNLPISGSLNDPQFKLGSVIFKLIGNLIVKAITAPFSLLSGAFGGGGDELGTVRFAPGSGVLTADAKAGLDKVAKALTDRPALKLTVTGSAAMEAEREALKRERLGALLLAEKRRRASVATEDAALVEAVSEAEYPVLLKTVYRRADMAKPRNMVGLTKDISVADMESLLMANIRITEDAMQALALQRGVAVKDYLAGKQLAAERLFLGGAKLVTADDKWKPQAELSLSNR